MSYLIRQGFKQQISSKKKPSKPFGFGLFGSCNQSHWSWVTKYPSISPNTSPCYKQDFQKLNQYKNRIQATSLIKFNGTAFFFCPLHSKYWSTARVNQNFFVWAAISSTTNWVIDPKTCQNVSFNHENFEKRGLRWACERERHCLCSPAPFFFFALYR